MKIPSALAFASLTLAGCAAMDSNQCRSADWYQVGYRDGLFGIQRMAAPDRVVYARGWQEGVWEADARRAHGGEE
jgi:hypothetical protein